jgi:hypothetical protein
MDITKHYQFQRILIEAAQYRTLRQVFKSDPQVSVGTAALIRDIICSDRDDVAFMQKAVEA